MKRQAPADGCWTTVRTWVLAGAILVFGAWIVPAHAQEGLPGSVPVTSIRVLESEERAYASLGIPEDARINPEATTRLLILRDGQLLIDYGLKHSLTWVTKRGGGRWQEETVERVEVASDESSAIIKRFRFRGVADEEGETDPQNDPFRRLAEVDLLSTELVWVDADNPEGRWARGTKFQGHGDTGTASRFFYTAKADKKDRLQSKHPTVKPVDLIAYLCRLITPPTGLILDPFAGSGTTGMACLREGFKCILIEREDEYVKDIRHRLKHVKGEDAPLFAEVRT